MRNYKNPYEAPSLTHQQLDNINVESGFLALIAGPDGWYMKDENGVFRLLTETEIKAYQLPTAGEELGGVKSGGSVTIKDGIITVKKDSHTHTVEYIENLQDKLNLKANSKDVYGKDNVYTKTEVDNKINNKVEKVSGKGLSTNDYTTAEKTKLSKIAENANNYVLPIAKSSAIGGIKSGGDIEVNSDGVVNIKDSSHNHNINTINGLQNELNAKVNKASSLKGYGITDAYTKAETDAAIAKLVNSSSDIVKNLQELSEALDDNEDAVVVMNENIAKKADKKDIVGKKNGMSGEIFNDYEGNKTNIPFAHIEGRNNTAIIKTVGIVKQRDKRVLQYEAFDEDYNFIYIPENTPYNIFITDPDDPTGVLKYRGTLVQGSYDNLYPEEGIIWTVVLDRDLVDSNGNLLNFQSRSGDFLYSLVLDCGTMGKEVDINTMPSQYTIHMQGYQNQGFLNSNVSGAWCKAGYNATADGFECIASGERSFAHGYCNIASGHESDAKGQQTKATGYCASTKGSGTTASGKISTAEGSGTIASGDESHAQNISTQATGQGSTSTGNGTIASGNNSFTMGYQSQAQGENSLAIGEKTVAVGKNSIAGGSNSQAGGLSSIALGRGCSTGSAASGGAAIGDGNSATGIGAVALGKGTTAQGPGGFSAGTNTKSVNEASFAQGIGTTAGSQYQFAHGKYNKVDWGKQYAEIVGNGTADNARSNAYTLDWDGNAWYAGMIECAGIILKSPGGLRFKITVENNGELVSTAIRD